MKKIQVHAQVGRAENEAAEVLVLLHCEGGSDLTQEAAAIDAQLGGQLAALIQRGEFEGKLGEGLLVHTQGKARAKRLLLAGLGKEKDLRVDAFRQALGIAIKRVRQAKVTSFAVVLPAAILEEIPVQDVAQAMAEGAILGNYQFTAYRSPNGSKPIDVERLTIYTSQASLLPQMTEGIRRGVATAEATVLVRDLCNHPANVMTPTRIVREAKAVAKESGVRLKVLEQKDMEQLGMGALLGVARGSHEPPKFIILEYKGAKAKKGDPPVVLVGKGITFDTGGISLKPAPEMDEMKYDMGGAASVLGALRAVAELKPKVNVVGLIPTCENMPSGRATKPGDVVVSMSGQTIEVLNTDAEGRLILCDALTYAERYKPAAVVDVATLTGAIIIALGNHQAGLFASDDALAEQLLAASRAAQDPCWRMPLDDEYDEGLKSHYADMANVGSRAGGSITAAKFLQRFTGKFPWAHLDVAGVAHRSGAAKGATGRPVGLLTHFVLARARKA